MKKQIFTMLIISFMLTDCCNHGRDCCDGCHPELSQATVFDSTFIDTLVPVPQFKAVLLENITGVRCTDCPDAELKANEIKTQKSNDSVVVMDLYPEDLLIHFTFPYDGVPQLSNQLSKEIVEKLGVPQQLPVGYVDRKKFNGYASKFTYYTGWADIVNESLREKTPVNISIFKTLSLETLRIEVKLQYNDLASFYSNSKHKFALYLVEDGIVSPQNNKTGVNNQYLHNNVLRRAFGRTMGNPLTEKIKPGLTYIRQFSCELSEIPFNVANCKIICLVIDGNTEEVINVRRIEL